TTTTIDKISLGMRHRAGLGMSEQSDVLCLIVSEETGSISVAEDGRLYRGLSRESLRKLLSKKIEPEKQKGMKDLFDFFKKKE
ncbi:MAG: DNA integrity scanning protein DisA nucleotide-binding domain protein, partial [Bacteroidota bacterium]